MQSHCHKTPRRHPDWCHRQLFPSTPTRTYPSCYSVGGALRGACLMRQRPTNGAWVPRSFKLRFGMATSAASCFHMLIVGTRISEDKPPCTLYLWPGSTPQSCISWLSLHSASGQGVLPSQIAFVYSLGHFYCLCFAYVWPGSTPQPCASGSLVCVPGRGVLPSRLSK